MKLFEKLASYLRGDPVKDKVDMSFERLSDLPLAAFVSGMSPFDQWCHPDITIPEEHQGLVRCCVRLYQFFTFFYLIWQRYGKHAAVLVLSFWQTRLSKDIELFDGIKDTELFKTLQDGVIFIQKAVQKYAEKPYVADLPDGGSFEAPVEYWLAVRFLLELPDSPFRMAREEVREPSTRDVPNFGDLDFKLADCLADGKRRAAEVFGHMIEVANVTTF